VQIFASMIFASAIRSARCSAKHARRARAERFGRYLAYDYGIPSPEIRARTAANGSAGVNSAPSVDAAGVVAPPTWADSAVWGRGDSTNYREHCRA
jgi:hypothetical protein